MPRSVLIGWFALVALAAAAPLAAQDDSAGEGLQAVVTTADDEQIGTRIVGLEDGNVQLATDPPRSLPLADIARIDVGRELANVTSNSTDLIWIGQDNHDLVQVGGASGGNGIQDLHLHAENLRGVGIKQITVVCRFPKQLRVWRFDTSQSPHWRLAIARADLATEAELYLEPASIDSFGQKFDVTYTYNDGIKAKASVTATTHTSDQQKINRRVRAGSTEAPSDGAATDGLAEVYLGDSGKLRGELTAMDSESLTLRTEGKTDIRIPLLRAVGVWFGGQVPEGALTEFQSTMADPQGEDVVFVVAADKTKDSIHLSVQGLTEDKLAVKYQGEERSINRDRVLGIVFAAHPSLEPLANPVQIFEFAGGDRMTGKWVGYGDGKLEIETAWNDRIQIPAKDVGQIRVRGGKLTFLPDLEPIDVKEVPYFGRMISWSADAGFDGEPPKLRGKTPSRVLAMHSRCVLTYALEGEYEKFKTTLGFDDSAGKLGRVGCRVLVDGREAFVQPDFRADQDPIPLEISLAGARQMSLEVDFGEAGDVGDRILWVDPRLFRAEGQ